jgi:hypothetical protein
MITEEFQLRSQDLLDGPPDDGLPHINGQGLDGIEVDIEPRTFVPISTAGDDFPPPVRHVAQIGQIVGLTLGERHGLFVLELGERAKLGKSA